MPCYKPLGGYLYTLPDGKRRVRFIPRYQVGDEHNCRFPDGADEFVQIPCGKCIGCRLDYASSWADRLCVEALDFPSEKRWFLTLTYDDAHLPPAGASGIHTLVPRHLTLWMKRLRRRFPDALVRFYASGEYGDKSGRPHYHVILFGVTFDDLRVIGKTDLGYPLFESPLMESIWSHGKVCIAEFSWNTASYVARYVLKKLKGKGARQAYDRAGIVPEFCRMSRRPGIGFNRYDAHTDSYQLPNGRIGSLPKSFIEKLKKTDPEAAEAILVVRKSIGDLYATERSLALGVSVSEWLKRQSEQREVAAKTLKGGLHNA